MDHRGGQVGSQRRTKEDKWDPTMRRTSSASDSKRVAGVEEGILEG